MQEVAKKIDHSQAESNAEAMAPASPHEVLEHLVGDVRKKVREVFIEAAETEFRSFIGADPHQRTSERQDQRNGDRTRDLVTEMGPLVDLPIPRPRQGNFMPSFLGRWQRSQHEGVERVAEMCLRGVSTRKAAKLAKA